MSQCAKEVGGDQHIELPGVEHQLHRAGIDDDLCRRKKFMTDTIYWSSLFVIRRIFSLQGDVISTLVPRPKSNNIGAPDDWQPNSGKPG